MDMFRKLIDWSLSEYSHLPWRENRSLYHTLVSEIMLQQTTVGTVQNHFARFLNLYPDLSSLAQSTEAQVTEAWRGLGYYRRARNLRKASLYIWKEKKGNFPLDYSELKEIPGIGDYTASALLSIGADLPFLSVDANLERVLSRIFFIKDKKGLPLQKKIRTLFNEKKILRDIDKWGARSLNEALMDLGRTFCQARKADCLICPMNHSCLSFQKGLNPLDLPQFDAQKEAAQKKYELILIRGMIRKGDKILGYVKNKNEWLSGQVEIPTFILSTDDLDFVQYPKYKGRKKFKSLPELKSSITKYKIKNLIWETSKKNFQEVMGIDKRFKYYHLCEDNAKFSTTTLKILKKLGWTN